MSLTHWSILGTWVTSGPSYLLFFTKKRKEHKSRLLLSIPLAYSLSNTLLPAALGLSAPHLMASCCSSSPLFTFSPPARKKSETLGCSSSSGRNTLSLFIFASPKPKFQQRPFIVSCRRRKSTPHVPLFFLKTLNPFPSLTSKITSHRIRQMRETTKTTS